MTVLPDTTFHPATNLRQVTVFLFGVGTIGMLIGIVGQMADLAHISKVGLIAASQEAVSTADMWRFYIGVATTLCVTGGGVVFLFWLYRMRKNLPALVNSSFSWSPFWCFGSFIVPFGNLILPYFVTREIYRDSDPVELLRSSEGRLQPNRGKYVSPQLLAWWWFCIAISGILNTVLKVVAFQMPDRIMAIGRMLIFIDVILVIGLVLTSKLVLHITKMQTERYAKINPGGFTPYK